MNLKHLPFFLLFLSLPFVSKAQFKLSKPAYIITIHKDTVKGLINEKSLFETRVVNLKFKKKDKLYRSFRFEEIEKVVVLPDRVYKPRKVNYKKEKRLVMMRLAVEGYASIYFTRFDGKDEWYFLERKGKLSHANRKRFGPFATLYFIDCNGWDERNKKISKYRYDRLVAITTDYNECLHSKPPTKVWIPPAKRGFSYGFRIALLSNHWELPEASYYENAKLKGHYPGGGIFITYQTSDNFLIRTEFNLLERGSNAESANVPPLFRPEVKSDFDFDLLQAELAVIFQWQKQIGNFRPYLITGPSLGRGIVSELNETNIRNGIPGPGREASLSSDYLVSLYGGGGLSLPINKEYQLFFEGRYGIAFTKMKSVSALLDLSLKSIQMGIGLKKEL